MKAAPKGVQPRDTSIRIWFMWKGKRQWETLKMNPTASNIKHAARMREEVCTKIALGIFDYLEYFPDSKNAQEFKAQNAKPTFSEIADKWLATINHLAPSTLAGYRKMLKNYPVPIFGHTPIDQIKYSDIAELLGSVEWSSMKTRNNVATVIRQPFELAFIDGLIDINPAARIKNMQVQKEAPDPFTLAEANQIIQQLHDNDEPVFANYFEFAFFTGLRTSELFALTWQDIDFKSGLCRVSKAVVSGITKSTKNYTVRDIELNSRALAALERQKQHSLLNNKHIFLDPRTKQPMLNDKVPFRPWQLAVRLTGIRYRKPYNTRHTFATLNLMAGALPMWVSRQMGHKNMKMLLENYSRWIDQADKQKEKNKLDAILLGQECAKTEIGTNFDTKERTTA